MLDPTWVQKPISEQLLRDSLSTIKSGDAGDKPLKIAQLSLENGTVTIGFDVPDLDDADSLIEGTGMAHLLICQLLFQHHEVKKVITNARVKSLDTYNQQSNSKVVTITWTRRVFSRVDFDKLKDLGNGEQVYSIADSYSIDAKIWAKFDHKDKLNDQQAKQSTGL